MCMGGGDGGAGAIKKQNQQTQQKIDQGMNQLNAIFFGGSYGANPASSYNQGTNYFTSSGQAYQTPDKQALFQWGQKNDPMISRSLGFTAPQVGMSNLGTHRGNIGNGTSQISTGFINNQNALYDTLARDYNQSQAKQGNLFTSVNKATGFGPEFYGKAQNAYLQNALPQLGTQFENASNQLQYKLANQGILGGGADQDLRTSLNKEMANQKINIGNQAIGQTQDLQRQVNQQYSNLVGQLEASANPSAVAQQALQTASGFSAPSPLLPVGQLFNNWMNTYLAGQVGNQYGNFQNSYLSALNNRVPTTAINAPTVTAVR